ncbi:MAG: NAD(P)-dependent oxidoreductase [Gaiella sp.]
MRLNVGFVGLGNLGRHLAASIARAGYRLTVHDVDHSAAEPLLAGGARWAESPAETAAASEIVVTCLPSPSAVTAVVEGERSLSHGFSKGSTWIDTSTGDEHELRRLAALLAAKGVDTLECPVTGGVHRAAAGEITVIAGGDADVFERCRPLLEAMGGEVFHVGELGRASALKVVTNMLAFIHLVADGEALMLSRRAGLDLTTAWQVIRASSGNSFVHETEGQLILSGSYDVGFSMDLAAKDLGFATRMGEELGVPLELAELVADTFARARDAYGGTAQSTMVVKLLEDAVGESLRAPGFPAQLEPS